MYYKVSDSNKTIHNMATAKLFICKQEISWWEGVGVINPFTMATLGLSAEQKLNC